MKDYQTYLFDLDGTLIKTTELIVACFRYTIPKYFGFLPDDKTITRLIGLPLRGQVQVYLDKVGVKWEEFDFNSLENDHLNYQLKIWSKYVKVFPRVISVLEKLQNKKKKLGVVTSRKIQTTKLYLEYNNLLNFFDIVVTPENTTKHKPNKEPLEYAIKHLKINKTETIYIGDSIYDIMSAQATGIDQAFIDWGTGTFSEVSTLNPTYTISNLDSLFN